MTNAKQASRDSIAVRLPAGLRLGSKITIYMVGGAEVWGGQWRKRVWFAGYERNKTSFYYREHMTSVMRAIPITDIERVEEGWHGIPVDVRKAKNLAIEEEVKRANEINRKAPVKITKEEKTVTRKPIPDHKLVEAINLVRENEKQPIGQRLTQAELAQMIGIGNGSITAISKAVKGKRMNPKFSQALWQRAWNMLEQLDNNRINGEPKEAPQPVPTKELVPELKGAAGGLDYALTQLLGKRHQLQRSLAELDAKIEVLNSVKEEYFS